MANDPTSFRADMLAVLRQIVGNQPVPPGLQRQAFDILTTLLNTPSSAIAEEALLPKFGLAPDGIVNLSTPTHVSGLAVSTAAATAVTDNRRLIYVHGICRHVAGFSTPWWNSLHPFVPNSFGPGVLGQTRLEVIWSDLVNQSLTAAAAPNHFAAASVASAPMNAARQQMAEEIKEALRDRADQQILNMMMRTDGFATAPLTASHVSNLISIPGLNCIDDFSIYLIDDVARQQIINRFIGVVHPQLQAGRELDIISHSWGTVVAYEALRQLEDEGFHAPLIRNFFTVGAALSIGPVKLRLRSANKDGRKPANVRRWVNLNAHGDIIGGSLKGRPYAVDFDFVNLEAVGCHSLLGIVNPLCAHGSYFERDNLQVNKNIFSRFIET